MYWNNPLIEIRWPGGPDPIKASMHNGNHRLFFNPYSNFDNISTNQRLDDLCSWAREWMLRGLMTFCSDPRNYYDIANLVKLNIWIADIRKQGIVKPWLIQDQGDGTFLAGTGDSRLRCLERIPEIKTVPAFISTHRDRAHLYESFESVDTFDRFAELCGAVNGQNYLFRLTDPTAPYGLYWYEYDSERTRVVTPGEEACVRAFHYYALNNPSVIITPEWFDTLVDWRHYTLYVQ